MGASGGSCVASMAAPAGGSSSSGMTTGVAAGNTQSSAIPSGPQGGSRRPSRIPQPSRLPQPLRHHPGAEPEGPNKMSGMELLSVFVKYFVSQTKDVTEERIWFIYGPGSAPCPVTPSLLPPGASPQGKRPIQTPDDQAQTPNPRAMVGPLPSTPTSKSRPAAMSSMAPPLTTPALGKDGLPPPPPSPGQKPGSGFWSSMPGSPASRPGSFTFPGEAGESLVRQNSNQIQTGSGSGNQTHRHSTHSKEADRMSTCSSASEQSIQSNGVRLLAAVVLLRLTLKQREAWSVLSVSCPATASSTNLSPTTPL